MAFETREEVLEKIMEAEKPKCPHCEQEMSLWEVPPMNFSDGLGWGIPFLYVCFNDTCPLFEQGWENLRENYAHHASYRCMCYPGEDKYECMPVFSPEGATGQIIDDEMLMAEEALKAAIKKGFSILATCYTEKDGPQALRMLLDSAEPVRVRMKAAEMLGDFGSVEAVEPMRYSKFGNQTLQKQVEDAIKKIHVRSFTRECPFCAEIIKKGANICKHCGKEVAGQ